MNQKQQIEAANALIALAHTLLADSDGVLPDDYHACTTAIVMVALDIQLGGLELRQDN